MKSVFWSLNIWCLIFLPVLGVHSWTHNPWKNTLSMESTQCAKVIRKIQKNYNKNAHWVSIWIVVHFRTPTWEPEKRRNSNTIAPLGIITKVCQSALINSNFLRWCDMPNIECYEIKERKTSVIRSIFNFNRSNSRRKWV